MTDLVNDYKKLINKHYSAVQTDTDLAHTDSWSLEKKAKKFWDEFRELEQDFIAKLENIHANG